MSLLRTVLVVALAALAAGACAGSGSAATACSGLQRCILVPGPWVIVPANGEVKYLLVCPDKAIAAGTEALVTSQQVQVSFDAILGSPVAYGRSTNYEVLFRAVSASHTPGAFQPSLGCLPTPSGVRNTTGVTPVPAGTPLTLDAASITAVPGASRSGSLGCGGTGTLVDSWTAVAFATPAPPKLALASSVEVTSAIRDGHALASVRGTDGLTLADRAVVQLGVRCTSG
jgi:hypothetical protein